MAEIPLPRRLSVAAPVLRPITSGTCLVPSSLSLSSRFVSFRNSMSRSRSVQ